MAGDQLSFQGVGYSEAQDRDDEHRTGVPGKGGSTVLLDAPSRRTAKVSAMNTGEEDAEVRLKVQGKTNTQTAEKLTALTQAGNKLIGKLQFGQIVPKSVVFTEAGAPVDIVDDGLGTLYDTGFVGVAANKRGTINYVLGTFSLTWSGAATELQTVTYQHTDFVDFASANQTTTTATGGVTPSSGTPFVVTLGFGRVVPGSVSMVEGTPLTFTDDGKGNIIETTVAGIAKRGTIDYAKGVISLTGSSAALSGNMVTTYKYNPFAALLVHAGGQKGLELFPGSIPEISAAAWANGLKDNPRVGLCGESRSAAATNLVTRWAHYGEDEGYRVRELFSGFAPGGQTNDPRLSGQKPFSAHL